MAAFVLTIVASSGIYALLGIGVVLIYRTSRILNIAGGEIAIFIGYLVAVLIERGLSFSVAIPFGILASIALGSLAYWSMIRRIMGEPPYVGLMLTVGIGIIFNGLITILFGGGMLGIPIGLPGFIEFASIRMPTANVVAAVSAWLAIAIILIVYWVTNLGLQMRAVAEKVTLSAQRGINVDRTVALSWVIGVVAFGLAGVLHGERAVVSITASVIGVSSLIACLIGGMDSLKGVIIGAIIVSIAENFTALYIDPRYVLIAPVIILFVILVVRPWGLFGTVEEFKRV